METFAYIHLTQDYEAPELKEFAVFQNGLNFLRSCTCVGMSSAGSIALLSLLCTTWTASLVEEASAYSSVAPGQNYVMIRPDGDQAAVIQPNGSGCAVQVNPCGGLRPIYPQQPIVDPVYRPVYPDSGYRPVRPLPIRPATEVFLRRGDVGSDVRYVQDLLRSAGYFDATSTGFYATLTESGVKAFQRDRGLGIDGIVGPQTLAALEGRAY